MRDIFVVILSNHMVFNLYDYFMLAFWHTAQYSEHKDLLQRIANKHINNEKLIKSTELSRYIGKEGLLPGTLESKFSSS